MLSENKTAAALGKIAEWSLYILIFVLPFSKSMIEIAIVIGLISLVAKKIMTGERLIANNVFNIALLLFVLLSLPSFINTAYMAQSVKALFTKTLKFAALFLVAQGALNTKEKLANFSIMALISSVVIILDAFIQYYITHIDILHAYPSFQYCPGYITRLPSAFSPYSTTFLGFPTASFPFPNDFAAWILVMIFPALTFTLVWAKGAWKRVGLGAVFAGLLFFLMATKTRGAWLGFALSLLIVPFLGFKNTRKVLGVLMAVIILMSPLIIFKKDVRDSIISFSSLTDRGVMWSNSCKIFKQHPIVGNGINTFFVNYMNIRDDEHRGKRGSYAHNCYLQMAAEIGLIGLLGFLGFAVSLIVCAISSARKAADPFLRALLAGLVLGIIAYLVHSAADTNLYSLSLAALFWVSSGVLAAAINLSGKGRA